MSRGLVAIVFNALADPRRTGLAAAPHLIHEEIPVVEEVLDRAGWEPFAVPVGDDVVGALGTLATRRPRAIVNLCDDLLGRSDHEMHLAGAFELLGIPYTGAPPLALGLCRDKVRTKMILQGHGIPTAPFVVAARPGDLPPLSGLRFPVIVKPAAEDGSLGITDASVAGDERSARRVIAGVVGTFGPALVEEYVDGRELNVPVLGNAPPRILPISEIDFSGLPPGLPRICGYEAKWVQDDSRYGGTVGVCPANLAPDQLERIERWSMLAFRALGLRDYARIDWRLPPSGDPVALEANPNPDISPSSGFLRSVHAAGLGYPEFIGLLIDETLARG